MTVSDLDSGYMQRALSLAERGLYTTDPNPRVGCLIVRDGKVVGEGWHQRAGEPHAERHALAMAGDAAGGATCYVTLEPCSHTGRTGPCADALIAAGVSRVVAAMQDPNPLVAGQGLAKLRDAGIRVECGLLEAQAQALNPGFIKRMQTGLPLVRIKLAMSLDGRTAMASGESKWITGAEARQQVQRLRARSSAIVTGIGTVLADDPALTVRVEDWPANEYPGVVRQPLRVVLDRKLRLPLDAKLLRGDGDVLVISQAQPALASALQQRGAEVVTLPGSGSGTDLRVLLETLAERACNEVLVEAGPTLAGAFVREQLFDELVIFMAPTLLGSSARPLLLLPEIATMAEQHRLRLGQVEQIGDDLCLTYLPTNCR
ncbi:MAG: bifunctional diaminohydroxyphosphoribosylaminopyrimidine deaminase/5-amino-6-(5-phosphoribosylamino)uracil reductase RibD [Alcanivoracaceae bacterium]|jgi:diaminohydroxyphosphoribosylaminopyrimidine deaminase/5-amino-6-(5-phosphoribosylamino)uracil reductase|nr:bifunctional diaminohydroxyphosphoribosylaminopyrimidine deaminase/5-amino-6-(5-phosphoribosylamino)uracil reductase RibD [Alcanivoracaceae bacterium]